MKIIFGQVYPNGNGIDYRIVGAIRSDPGYSKSRPWIIEHCSADGSGGWSYVSRCCAYLVAIKIINKLLKMSIKNEVEGIIE